MTPRKFTIEMKKIAQIDDPEIAHGEADDLLCEVLKKLGYEKGVKVFEDIPKWYA